MRHRQEPAEDEQQEAAAREAARLAAQTPRKTAEAEVHAPEQPSATSGPALQEHLAALTTAAALRRRRRRMVYVGAWTWMILFVVLALVGHGGQVKDLVMVALAILGGLAVVSGVEKRAVRAVAGTDDVRAIGPMAEALTAADAGTRHLARNELVRLLQRMNEADVPLVNDMQRQCLNGALGRHDRELVLAVLKALARIGDRTSLVPVERLAAGEGAFGSDPRFREAAESCLRSLQARIKRAEAHQRLVRPASAPASAKDSSLRPAQGASPADPDRLPRAADSPEE